MAEQMSSEAKTWRAIAIAALGFLTLLALIETVSLIHSARNEAPPAAALPPVSYEVVSYDSLAGWSSGNQAAALAPFLRTCATFFDQPANNPVNPLESLGLEENITFAGRVGDWVEPCRTAEAVGSGDDVAARAFFEQYFQPVQLMQPADHEAEETGMTAEGMFTGYFEPAYPASRERTDEYSVPALSRPTDLVMVDLGAFRDDLAGTRIAGRVINGRLFPYEDHKTIVENGLDTDVIAWMKPNDLLFLQIQGSGRLFMGGEELRVGYAAQNGHPYTAIGGPLIRSGAIAREDMSMQAIYDWLDSATPEEAAALRYVNQSYVFFRHLDALPVPALGPIGASGVQLEAGTSLAVDRRFHAMGAPLWVDYESLDPGERIRRLMVAQDTGGAIRGPVRGDVFTGSGHEAGEVAGAMRQSGTLHVLLPLPVARRLEPQS